MLRTFELEEKIVRQDRKTRIQNESLTGTIEFSPRMKTFISCIDGTNAASWIEKQFGTKTPNCTHQNTGIKLWNCYCCTKKWKMVLQKS